MERKHTITSVFIVPTLSIGRDRLIDNGFINGYTKDSRRDVQYENAVYLLFKPTDLDKFRSFLDKEYERTKSIIDDYDYEDGYNKNRLIDKALALPLLFLVYRMELILFFLTSC